MHDIITKTFNILYLTTKRKYKTCFQFRIDIKMIYKVIKA